MFEPQEVLIFTQQRGNSKRIRNRQEPNAPFYAEGTELHTAEPVQPEQNAVGRRVAADIADRVSWNRSWYYYPAEKILHAETDEIVKKRLNNS